MKRERAKSREGMTGTTVWLPAALHRRVAQAALDDGKSQAVIMREALVLWLAARTRARRKRGGER